MTDKSVTILSDSDDILACVLYSDVICKKDYEIFFEKMKQNLENSGRLKVLVVFEENFKGWEIDAAEANFGSYLHFAPKAEKIAYVNPTRHKIFKAKIAEPLIKGEVRFFDRDSYQEALNWVKEDD
jgi:hypothetical protein